MIQPKKRLGQNFLRDPNTARKIVGALAAPEDSIVVEIGPGTGALTGLLFGRYANLLAIEVDPRAVGVLQEQIPGLNVRCMDVLDCEWSEFVPDTSRSLYIIGNLPYNITTPILFGILESPVVKRAVLMMQKEVAERIVAKPRTKAYGTLSVMSQLFARPELLFKVPPTVFHPRPAVTSAVLSLDFESDPGFPAALREPVRQTVRTAFNQRRKTLRNSVRSLLENADSIPPENVLSRRAEELNPNEFVELARVLFPGV